MTQNELATALRAAGLADVVGPSDSGYDEARRVWNGMIDRHPGAVARALRTDDVRRALEVGRRLDVPIAVRGGGHNVAGNGTVDDGLVIDLGGWSGIDVDAGRRVVRVPPGAVLADVDRATVPHGIVVPIGVVSQTGVTGLTLGGGVGWLTRAYGLTIDSLLGAEVVTPDGEVVRAGPEADADLFWALRGGGGNFGVVTSLEFRAYPRAEDAFAGNLVYGRAKWRDALRAWRDWCAGLPDEFTTIGTFVRPLPAWDMGDETLLLLGGTWAGEDPGAGRRVLDALAAAVAPDVFATDPMPWIDWQSAADEMFPNGVHAYWKNAAFDELGDPLVDEVVARAETLTWHRTGIDLHLMGGAVAAVPEASTAWPNRHARFLLNVYGTWDEPARDAERIAWVRAFAAAVQPFAAAGRYVNFLGHEGPDADPRTAALEAYGPATLRRLIELKRRYDPSNVLRRNHNIDPAWSPDDLPTA